MFYNSTNKKEYNLQIWQHNLYYQNIIAIKDMFILKKTREKKKLSEDIADIIVLGKLAWALSLINFVGR